MFSVIERAAGDMLRPMLLIAAAVRVHDDARAACQRHARQNDLANVAGAAREMNVDHIGMMTQLQGQLGQRLRERHGLGPLVAFDHGGNVSGVDILGQGLQQQPFHARNAAANIQPGAEHQDVG